GQGQRYPPSKRARGRLEGKRLGRPTRTCLGGKSGMGRGSTLLQRDALLQVIRGIGGCFRPHRPEDRGHDLWWDSGDVGRGLLLVLHHLLEPQVRCTDLRHRYRSELYLEPLSLVLEYPSSA